MISVLVGGFSPTPSVWSISWMTYISAIVRLAHKARKESILSLQQDAANVNNRFMLATALEGAGKLDEAVQEYGIAVEKGRRNLGVAHCNYANILMKAGKPEEALRYFDHAIETDPSNPVYLQTVRGKGYILYSD